MAAFSFVCQARHGGMLTFDPARAASVADDRQCSPLKMVNILVTTA
jgi:hypothetical protein